MADLTYYNDDPRYELMAALLENSNAFGGDAEPFKDEFIEILKLCYTYTVNGKWDAHDLAEAIVSYMGGRWGVAGFEAYARDYWTPARAADDEPEPEPSEDPSDQDQLLIP